MGDADSHQRRDLPLLLAGGCGGYSDTGRVVRYGEAASTNQLLVSLANAMDCPITRFGDPRVTDGPLPRVAA